MLSKDEREKRNELIRADVKAGGLSYAKIAERHGVGLGVVKYIVKATGNRRQERKPCSECGKQIRAFGVLCFDCMHYDHESPAILARGTGAWVLCPRRRIQVWRDAS